MSRDERETHPSYGMIRVSRIQGGGVRLFGSKLPTHNTFMELEIREGSIGHDLGRDWYSGSGGKRIVTIHMSNVQFAELITSLNIGDGVPCTIKWDGREEKEEPPLREIELTRIRNAAQKDMNALAGRSRDRAKPVLEKLKSLKLPKGVYEEVAMVFHLVEQDLEKNMPFAAEQFQRAADKVEQAVKAEVDAFMLHAVHKVGLAAIAERGADAVRKLLTGDTPEVIDAKE